tara:strand:- start:373 stop:819 length:447 start_codon:yes stop_codon:yes gene_type:complete
MAVTTGSAFAKSTTAGYTVRTSSTTSTLANTGDTVVSAAIDSSVDSIENKVIVAGIDVKVAYANVEAHFGYQLSHNGSNWSRTVDIETDTTPDVTGVHVFRADLSNVYAPYFRFIWNPSSSVADILAAASDNVNVGTSGTLQVFFAYK